MRPDAVAAYAGPWGAEQVDTYLRAAAIPIRLACHGTAGFPLVLSLWYHWDGVSLWCAVQKDSQVAKLLSRDGRCAFEVAADRPPYRGVRGSATAELIPAEAEPVLRRLIARYLPDDGVPLARWLLGRLDTETALRLTPRRFYSWDFTRRMQGIHGVE